MPWARKPKYSDRLNETLETCTTSTEGLSDREHGMMPCSRLWGTKQKQNMSAFVALTESRRVRKHDRVFPALLCQFRLPGFQGSPVAFPRRWGDIIRNTCLFATKSKQKANENQKIVSY